MNSVKVGERIMAGGDKWPQLEIQVLATTNILHTFPPSTARKLAAELVKMADEHDAHNSKIRDEMEFPSYPDFE